MATYSLNNFRSWNEKMIVNKTILLTLLIAASLVGCTAAQDGDDNGVVETANDLGNLNTFVRAITQADMVETLNDEGILNLQNDTYIIFAPNDAAFRSLPSQAWNSIMANEDDLNTLLEYHIVENPDVDDIRNLRDIDTLEALDGMNINLSYDNGDLIVNGARVLESRMYEDGIIYVIDKVLLPDDDAFLDEYNLRDLRAEYVAAMAAGTAVAREANDTVAAGDMNEDADTTRSAGTANASAQRTLFAAERDFIDALRTEDDLSTFVRALTAADLGRDFYNRTNFTIFAPNDQAFSVIPEDTLEDLLMERDDLRALLRYHIIDRSNLTDDWNTTRGSVRTLMGRDLVIDRTDGEFTVSNATVLRTKYFNNSVIYTINRVLLPDDEDFLDRYRLGDIKERYETQARAAVADEEEDDTALPPQPRVETETNRTRTANATDDMANDEV